ncbi:unnamed protein product [Rangifer tarandus platyrhynchus]|uniref:Uncharacterized protein n=1 Tax=Rangifer tarandus platyrhynchus TaxID=3082113 RepID=A0AC59Z2J6_RANTA
MLLLSLKPALSARAGLPRAAAAVPLVSSPVRSPPCPASFWAHSASLPMQLQSCPQTQWDFLGGPVVKDPPANAGDTGSTSDPGRLHVLRGREAREPRLLSPHAPALVLRGWIGHCDEKPRTTSGE